MELHRFFVIAGAQRCGTTYLSKMLDQHPQICFAKPLFPEPKFFLNETSFKLGKQNYLERFYDLTKRTIVLGEKSTSYIESETAAIRIKAMFPDAQILFSLRNPVERAISNYHFSVSNNLEKRNIEVALNPKSQDALEFSTSVSPFNYLDRGNYFKYLGPYFKIFGQEKIKIVLFEELTDPVNSMAEIFEFMKIDSTFQPIDRSIRVNAGNVYTTELDVLQSLIKFYCSKIEKLEELINKDLTVWREDWKSRM
ncbi:MAG: sulfotransferase [Cyclobacteriaceae bacterium]